MVWELADWCVRKKRRTICVCVCVSCRSVGRGGRSVVFVKRKSLFCSKIDFSARFQSDCTGANTRRALTRQSQSDRAKYAAQHQHQQFGALYMLYPLCHRRCRRRCCSRANAKVIPASTSTAYHTAQHKAQSTIYIYYTQTAAPTAPVTAAAVACVQTGRPKNATANNQFQLNSEQNPS